MSPRPVAALSAIGFWINEGVGVVRVLGSVRCVGCWMSLDLRGGMAPWNESAPCHGNAAHGLGERLEGGRLPACSGARRAKV